jgi:hypothetical protein
MLFRGMAKKRSPPPTIQAAPAVKRRGRPPRPGGPKPQVEVQRAHRARLTVAGKVVRLVDAVAMTPPSAIPGFDPATQLICDRETFEVAMRTRLHNALVELEVRVDDVKRLEARNDYLEGELRRSEQHHTIALKDIIVLKQQLVKRRQKLPD